MEPLFIDHRFYLLWIHGNYWSFFRYRDEDDADRREILA